MRREGEQQHGPHALLAQRGDDERCLVGQDLDVLHAQDPSRAQGGPPPLLDLRVGRRRVRALSRVRAEPLDVGRVGVMAAPPQEVRPVGAEHLGHLTDGQLDLRGDDARLGTDEPGGDGGHELLQPDLLAQRRFEPHPIGDVGRRDEDALRVEVCSGVALHPPVAAVVRPHAHHHRDRVAAFEHGRQLDLDLRHVVGVEQLEQRSPDQCGRRPSERGLPRLAGLEDGRVEVQDGEQIDRHVEEPLGVRRLLHLDAQPPTPVARFHPGRLRRGPTPRGGGRSERCSARRGGGPRRTPCGAPGRRARTAARVVRRASR